MILKMYLSLYTLLRSHLFVNCCIRRYSLYTEMKKSFPTFRDKLYPPGSWAVARLLRLGAEIRSDVLTGHRGGNSLCSNGTTSRFDRLEFHLEWCGACDPRSANCPSHDIVLHCGQCQSCSCGTSHHGWTGREYPRRTSSCISSWASSRWSTRDPPAPSRNGARGVALSWCSNWESRGDRECTWWISCSPPFHLARSARTWSRWCRRPSTTDILCTVLWVPHRVVRTIRCSQLHE